MPLPLVASVKSKWDRTRSIIEHRREYELVAGTNLTEEAQWMVSGGTTSQQATPSAGAAGEIPLGAAIKGSTLATTFANVEAGTVPSAAPFTFQMEHNNIVLNTYTAFADAYVFDTTASTELQVAAAAVAGVSVTLDRATGVITFAAGDAGHAFTVQYRWNMTTIEREAILRETAIGRGSEEVFGKTQIAVGNCTLYTTMYDADVAWAIGTQDWRDPWAGTPLAASPVMGVGGILTSYGQNNNGSPFGRVVSLPSATDPYLGVQYSTDVTLVP